MLTNIGQVIGVTVLVGLGYFAGAEPTFSAIVTAADGTRAGIQSAINGAAPGDVVAIPPGTWPLFGTVTLKEGIHIKGAGRDATILKRMDATSGSMFSLAVTSGKAFKISGITFEGMGFEALLANPGSTLIDKAITIYGKARGFEIFGCRFRKFSGHGIHLSGSGGGSTLPGHPAGVVQGNEFSDIFYSGSLGGLGYGVSVYGDSRWAGLRLGAGDAVFIENNTFARVRHCVASNNASKYVFRYNTVSQGYDTGVDAHGKTTADPGSRSYEIYNNAISGGIDWPSNVNSSKTPVGIRGGDGVIFNNSYTNAGSLKPFLRIENFVPGGGQSYPIECQTTDLWVWGNTLNGAANNTLDIGGWDPPEPLAPYLQSGRDYHFAQKPGYVPFLYPHPLRSFAGWWALDGMANAIAIDSSARGNNATLAGGPVSTVGMVGHAIELNGTNAYAQAAYEPSLNSPTFSFSAWVYVTGNTGAYRAVVSSRDAGFRGYILYAGSNNTWQFWTGNGSSYPSLQGPAVALNTWTHIAGTYDGTTKRLYINGSLYSSQSFTGYQPNAVRALRIGSGNNESSPTYYFKGRIDDVRVYSRALTPAEIHDLYDGLTGRWVFDDATGGVALDQSERGNDASLAGNPGLTTGIDNNAIALNGTNAYAQVACEPLLNSPMFSFSAWVYVTGNTGAYRAVVSSRDAGFRGYILYAGSNNTWQFWTGNGSSYPSLQGPAVTLNTWTHIVGAYDGTTKRLYINGSLYSSQPLAGYQPNTVRALRIGSGNNEGSPTYFFKGRIDDARVYSRALTAAEVGQIYAEAQ